LEVEMKEARQRHKELAAEFLALMSEGKTDAAMEMTYAQFEYALVAVSIGTVMPRDVFKTRANAMYDACNGSLRIKPIAMTAEGDRVAVEAEAKGTFHTGKAYRNKYHYIFTFRNGKITRIGDYSDSAHVMETAFPATQARAAASA
jgi:ketosteroid isomerase-like protein